jgi:hypothetical protein
MTISGVNCISYFMTTFSANAYLCNFNASLLYISTTLNVNQTGSH